MQMFSACWPKCSVSRTCRGITVVMAVAFLSHAALECSGGMMAVLIVGMQSGGQSGNAAFLERSGTIVAVLIVRMQSRRQCAKSTDRTRLESDQSQENKDRTRSHVTDVDR